MNTNIAEPLSATEQINAWRNVALNRFETSGPYSEMRNYYDGYASACEDVLKILKNETAAVVEEVVKTHKLRKLTLLAAVAGGAYIGYKRYENGVLFPWQKDDDK